MAHHCDRLNAWGMESNFKIPVQGKSRPKKGHKKGHPHPRVFPLILVSRASCSFAISPLGLNSSLGDWGRGQGPEDFHHSPGFAQPLASVGTQVFVGAAVCWGWRPQRGARRGWGLHGSLSGFPPGEFWNGERGVSPTVSPAPIKPLIHQGGVSSPARPGLPLCGMGNTGLSHCQTPLQRTPSASSWWASVLCLLPPGRD